MRDHEVMSVVAEMVKTQATRFVGAMGLVARYIFVMQSRTGQAAGRKNFGEN